MFPLITKTVSRDDPLTVQLFMAHHRLPCVGLHLIVRQKYVAGLLIDQQTEIAARARRRTSISRILMRLRRKPRRALGETRTRRGGGLGILKFPQAIPTKQLGTQRRMRLNLEEVLPLRTVPVRRCASSGSEQQRRPLALSYSNARCQFSGTSSQAPLRTYPQAAVAIAAIATMNSATLLWFRSTDLSG